MRFLKSKKPLAILFLLAASFMAWAQSTYGIAVKTAPNGSVYLTDVNGMTLYYYTADANGQSACSGKCADNWPVFFAPDPAVASPLETADFGTITRADGSKQTTYDGWPLYYWAKDKNPGDMTGDGVGKVWYVVDVPGYTVMVGTNKAVGNYLTDANGNSLYYFTKDSAGGSPGNGDLAKNWPAFTASAINVPSALNAADFSTISRSDGTVQVEYKGYPLYYWANDGKRGDITGQGVGGAWYLVDPAKFPPM